MTGLSLPPLSDEWRQRIGVLAIGSALFLLFIDQTALTTALPELARALGADPVHLKLTLTAYMLIQAALVPASGWVADRFGARRVFIISMAVFVAGSMLCAMAHSLGDLVLYRVVQGVGGGDDGAAGAHHPGREPRRASNWSRPCCSTPCPR